LSYRWLKLPVGLERHDLRRRMGRVDPTPCDVSDALPTELREQKPPSRESNPIPLVLGLRTWADRSAIIGCSFPSARVRIDRWRFTEDEMRGGGFAPPDLSPK